MSSSCKALLRQIDEKKERIDRSVIPNLVDSKLREHLNVEWTYNSNAIEGNTLTRGETFEIIAKGLSGMTVSGKPLKDYLEAVNHKAAIDHVTELAKSKEAITEHDIRQVHSLVLGYIDEENAGRYRTSQVYISGSSFVPPDPVEVAPLMRDLGEWLEKGNQDLHVIEYAAQAHLNLVTIHPFVDGNGRTARLLMNLILLQSGYPMAIVRNEDRIGYYELLEGAQTTGKSRDLVMFIAEAVDRTADMYLKSLPK